MSTPTRCRVRLYGDTADGGRDAGREVDALVADGHAAYVGWERNQPVARVTTRFGIIAGTERPM